jgi:hypothetical protein
LALTASIKASTSLAVRCSRVRSSAFGLRVLNAREPLDSWGLDAPSTPVDASSTVLDDATVRKISVGATNLSAEFFNEIPLPARQLFVLHINYEQSASGRFAMSQTVAAG